MAHGLLLNLPYKDVGISKHMYLIDDEVVFLNFPMYHFYIIMWNSVAIFTGTSTNILHVIHIRKMPEKMFNSNFLL